MYFCMGISSLNVEPINFPYFAYICLPQMKIDESEIDL